MTTTNNTIKVTSKEIEINFKGHHMVIPKGTRITHQTACGYDEGYNFISDLLWIDKKNNYPLWHDAYYYGIDIPAELTETKL